MQVDEGDVDWVVPQTEGDVNYMMEQLRQMGVVTD